MFGKTKYIHFIGIGGIGMSGMAELLHKLGFNISGSDLISSERTNRLNKLGIEIYNGHNTHNITNPDVVVYSSAINQDNPEIYAAKKKKIPIIRRAEMLAELLKVKNISVAIAGTHGKTTTCSMLGSILTEAKKKPTLVIGGIVNKFQSNAISGNGEIIVVEADEFDRSFLTLQPTIGLINNLDLEHLDCYENIEDLQNAFTHFANAVPFYGKVGICIDHVNTTSIILNIKRPIITYGINKNAEISALDICFNKDQTTFNVKIGSKNIGEFNINLPGVHNIQNALGAITIALELDIPIKIIKSGLNQYNGVRRRFEIKYRLDNGIIIIDDYAHHPSEVASTLEAVKSGWKQRIISIFQPHLFTRTRDFYKEFAQAFQRTDILIVTDIYKAREVPIPGINAELITKHAKKIGHANVEYISDQMEISHRIQKIAQPNDIIITMGAGNIWRQCENINKALCN
tara:strand:+ start:198 stop:1574 length:1377 start_codon:yes stop_codon:yes gene_type:complete